MTDQYPLCGESFNAGPTRQHIKLQDIAESSRSFGDTQICYPCWIDLYRVLLSPPDEAAEAWNRLQRRHQRVSTRHDTVESITKETSGITQDACHPPREEGSTDGPKTLRDRLIAAGRLDVEGDADGPHDVSEGVEGGDRR